MIDVQINPDYMLSLEWEEVQIFSRRFWTLEKVVRKMEDEGLISKITANRVGSLCFLIPPKNKNKFSIEFYKTNSQFSKKQKKFIYNALRKVEKCLKAQQGEPK